MSSYVGFFVFDGKVRSKPGARLPMDNSVSIRRSCSGESSRTIPVLLCDLGSGEEHVALLMDLQKCGLFRRWDDLFDEGVAAIFELASGKAELLALCFHGGKFTRARSATWLVQRRFKPLRFVSNSGTQERI